MGKKLSEENKELLKKYFEDLKKYNEKLLGLMPKVEENIFGAEKSIKEYRPKIMQALASIEEISPDIKNIEYVVDLKYKLEEDSFDDDAYHEIISAFGGIIGALEIRLRNKIGKNNS